MGGLELLKRVKKPPYSLPVVIVSGSSGISEAVQSMKVGAFDFIEKPVDQLLLLAGVRGALRHARSVKEHHDLHEVLLGVLAALTPREREIMQLVVAGHPSKNIAVDLGISQRTVENHRASIMHKTGAKSLPALGRMAESLSL